MFGSKVKTIKIDQRNLLPESIRRFDSTWTTQTGFGYYKAKFDMTYGSTGQELRFNKSFTVLPLTALGLGLLVLAIVFDFFWLPRKRLKKAFKVLTSSSD